VDQIIFNTDDSLQGTIGGSATMDSTTFCLSALFGEGWQLQLQDL
jgi:hypothetical protein